MRKQKGIAVILFLGFLPLMIITFTVALQLAQKSQSGAKLNEAAEVVSLALISEATVYSSPNMALAEKVVDAFVQNNESDVEVHVIPKHCRTGSACLKASGELAPFSDFNVTVSTQHNSWLSYTGVGLDPNFSVYGQSVSRKMIPEPIDIYFVVDFSNSMNKWFSTHSRLGTVKQTIKKIIDDLEAYNHLNRYKSRVALSGYNQYNVQIKNRRKVMIDHVVNNDPTATVRAMFRPKIPIPGTENTRWHNVPISLGFNDLPLTDDFDNFKKRLDWFWVDWGRTQSWQGLISAAQELDKQQKYNRRQAIIILSDGDDSERTSRNPLDAHVKIPKFMHKLVDAGLCRKLKTRVESKTDREGRPVEYIIGVIGVAYNPDPQTNGMYGCVGKENIFHARSGDDVYKHILKLLGEETGRLK